MSNNESNTLKKNLKYTQTLHICTLWSTNPSKQVNSLKNLLRQIVETLPLGYANDQHEGHCKKKPEQFGKASGQHLGVHSYTTEKIIIRQS